LWKIGGGPHRAAPGAGQVPSGNLHGPQSRRGEKDSLAEHFFVTRHPRGGTNCRVSAFASSRRIELAPGTSTDAKWRSRLGGAEDFGFPGAALTWSRSGNRRALAKPTETAMHPETCGEGLAAAAAPAQRYGAAAAPARCLRPAWQRRPRRAGKGKGPAIRAGPVMMNSRSIRSASSSLSVSRQFPTIASSSDRQRCVSSA
jgi:hypothetical protein